MKELLDNKDEIEIPDKDSTVRQIKIWLDINNILYKSNALKKDLLELIPVNENNIEIKIKPKASIKLNVNWHGFKKGQIISVTNREYIKLYKSGKGQ